MSENPLQENLEQLLKITSYRTALVLYLALYDGLALLYVIGSLFRGNYYFGIIVAAGLPGFSVKFPGKKKICEALQLDAFKLNNKIF